MPSANPTFTRPFHASSIRTGYGVQVRMHGRVTLRDNWLYVVADSGAVVTYQRDPAMYWDLQVRAGMAACDSAGGWGLKSEGRPVRIAPLVGLENARGQLDDATRPFNARVNLAVAIPPGTDINRAWLTFVFEWPVASALATYVLHADTSLVGTNDRVLSPSERALMTTTAPPLKCR